MKFYIAGRTSQAKNIKQMMEIILEKGHQISFDWTSTADIKRPYSEHVTEVETMSIGEIEGIKQADIFIIIGDESGTGMYVEMGVAIASGTKIYAIGAYNDVTVFHFHPNVIRKDSFAEVLLDLGI